LKRKGLAEEEIWLKIWITDLTGIWFRNFVCGWFDEKDYFEFRPADVVLRLKEVDRAEMRKYIPQFLRMALSHGVGLATWRTPAL